MGKESGVFLVLPRNADLLTYLARVSNSPGRQGKAIPREKTCGLWYVGLTVQRICTCNVNLTHSLLFISPTSLS